LKAIVVVIFIVLGYALLVMHSPAKTQEDMSSEAKPQTDKRVTAR